MQMINPFLWFDNQAEEAVNFYVSTFSSVFDSSAGEKKSSVLFTNRYGEAGPGPKGSVMIMGFQLIGKEFTALNGGPVKDFTFNPSISFFVDCKNEEELSELFKKLSYNGKIRMPLDKYPFSEWFVWIDDKFGVSWQLNLAKNNYDITPFLWFKNQAEEAMNYYTSIFSAIGANDLGIQKLTPFGENDNGPVGKVKHAVFTLNGQQYMAMDSNKENFSPAISLFVNCDTQKEVDELWNKLSEGGKTSQCGWLADKFGITWQIIPAILGKLMSDPDHKKSQRVMQAMLKMTKIESKILIEAYEQ